MENDQASDQQTVRQAMKIAKFIVRCSVNPVFRELLSITLILERTHNFLIDIKDSCGKEKVSLAKEYLEDARSNFKWLLVLVGGSSISGLTLDFRHFFNPTYFMLAFLIYLFMQIKR